MPVLKLSLALLVLLAAWPASAETLRIYIDGDYSVAPEGSDAIELGVRTALDELSYRVGDYEIELVPLDSRLNTKRSKRLFDQFEADPQGIAVIGGTYSPSYLNLRESINARGLPTLLPWSAAGPITRPIEDVENFLFRLSVDDSKAGPFLVRHAVDNLGCEAVALLTTDTGWGRSNRTTIDGAMSDRNRALVEDVAFDDNLGEAEAADVIARVIDSQADCMILVAGMPGGALLLSALSGHEGAPKVISHWGILAGNFTDIVSIEQRNRMTLHILQTCGLQAEEARPSRFEDVLDGILYHGLPVDGIGAIPASVGFVHGYDLTHVAMAALEQAMDDADFGDLDASGRRAAFKIALETLRDPVDGLLMVYQTPFGNTRTDGPDAHEALDGNDLCMSQFDADRLVPARFVQVRG